jgi:hypothetical protein
MTQEQLRMQMLAGIITEGQYKAKLNETTTDNVSDWDNGMYIEIDREPNEKEQKDIALAANEKFFVDPKKIKFETDPDTGEHLVFIPFAGDYANMLDVLKKFGIKEPPYTSPHLR